MDKNYSFPFLQFLNPYIGKINWLVILFNGLFNAKSFFLFFFRIYDFMSINILVETVCINFICIIKLVEIIFINGFSQNSWPSATSFMHF